MAGSFSRRGSRFGLFWIAFRLAVVLVVLWAMGLVWYAREIARITPGPDQTAESATADAVVVLTGTPDRLDVGFELLTKGHAQRMFVSGVYRGVDVQQILRALRRSPNGAENAVVLGYGADDTAGNAQETAVWMAKEGLTSIILVTSNFHMPRALLEFHAAMPEVTIFPHATAAPSFKIDDWWRWPGTVRLIASEWSKYIAARTVLAMGLRMRVRGAVSPALLTPQDGDNGHESPKPDAGAPEGAAPKAPSPSPSPGGVPPDSAPSTGAGPEKNP